MIYPQRLIFYIYINLSVISGQSSGHFKRLFDTISTIIFRKVYPCELSYQRYIVLLHSPKMTVMHFSNKDMHMANKHMKRCSLSLIIREIKIRTIIRYHLTPARMSIIKKSTNNKCWRECREKGTLCSYHSFHSYQPLFIGM